MVRLEKVSKCYGSGSNVIRAVCDVSLDVGNGELIIITGPSGSGKTTLLNLIGGMTRPDTGEIIVAGNKLLDMPDARLSGFRAHTIGFVFQFQSMLPSLDALDNVLLPTIFTRREYDKGTAESLLESVGLGDRMHACAHELSTGQQRRVGIARALINNPALLLCDEPTGDLDRETEAIILDMIVGTNRKGATVIMATHNLQLCSYANRSFTMRSGRLKEG